MENHNERYEVSLRSTPDFVAMCIFLHNFFIKMNDDFNENWISKAEEQLQRKIEIGVLNNWQELRCESASIFEDNKMLSIGNRWTTSLA